MDAHEGTATAVIEEREERSGQAPVDGGGRGRARRRLVPLWVLIALLAVAGASYWATRVERPPGDSPIRLTGVVVANEVVVAAKVTGRINELVVKEGSKVTKGQLVARLDRDQLDAEIRNQLAVLDQWAVKIRQAGEVATLEDERASGSVAAARTALQLAQSQRDEAAVTVKQLRIDLERLKALADTGLVSKQAVEQVDTDLRVAEARVKSLSDQVALAQVELTVATSNQRQVGIRQQDITTTQAQQRQAEAQLSQTEARLADTDVHAPLNGVVSLRLARQGEVVNAGDPIVTIIDLDDVWISAAVPESQMGRVALDDVLSVELASGERLEGRVSVISPEAAFATQRDVSRDTRDIRTFAIRVAVPNGERRLHAGMTAYVTLSRAPVRSDPPSR